MIKHVDFKNAEVIVELGAGDGVITAHILGGMNKDSTLFAFEVNPSFCEKLRKINDDRLYVIEDSAENLMHHLEEHNVHKIDYFISAIPFVVIPQNTAYSIVGLCRDVLKEGGKFIQVHYSLLTKKMYAKVFGNVDVNFVPFNLPPAFVLVSVKLLI
jgi:phospholipid N-methyltransferase